MFNDNEYILDFLTSEDSYFDQVIDEDEHDRKFNKSNVAHAFINPKGIF